MPASSGPLSCVPFFLFSLHPYSFWQERSSAAEAGISQGSTAAQKSLWPDKLFVNILPANTGAAQVPFVFMGTLWPAW